MQTERIPLSRSELLEMQRWIRKGWLPDESAIERIRNSLIAIVTDPTIEGRGKDRARVRAFKLLFEIEYAATKAAIGLEGDAKGICLVDTLGEKRA